MKDSFQDRMREALRLTREGQLREATDAIRQALGGMPRTAPAPADAPLRRRSAPEDADTVLDGLVFEVDDKPEHHERASPTPADATVERAEAVTLDDRQAPLWPDPEPAPALDAVEPLVGDDDGEFLERRFTHDGKSHRCKLYIPPGAAGRRLPLVVMLHGCTQGPDDFAAGTGMNERAREQSFFVLYPGQSSQANPSRCWNWFEHEHQQRGRGEPGWLAAATQAVIYEHGIDPQRVFIAGLSAGGAMAAIVAAAYPDVFAAVGVHSGLPLGAATSLPEALAAMKGAPARPNPLQRPPSAAVEAVEAAVRVPTIVFHGDQDRTVHPSNGVQLIKAALGRNRPGGESAGGEVEEGVAAAGRRYTRSAHRDDRGEAFAEHWLVHGAGHAWSGGKPQGSYTDPLGPDATQEMLRFFLAHPRGTTP